VKGYPFEVVLPEGLPVTGVVLADSLRNLDWQERRAERICGVSAAVVQAVVGRLNVLLAA
jgi:mRNA interferase MazF